MEKRQDEEGFNFSKLSLDDLKKVKSENQCRFKDFQPLLEYSIWHFFWPIVEEIIKECRESLNFLGHSIGKLHVLNEEKILEELIIRDLSKSATKMSSKEKERKLKVKTLKNDQNSPLHELFSHKRKYTKFLKD